MKKQFTEMEEMHCEGHISIETIPQLSVGQGDLGIQISHDGRVWLCINGIAFLRFKPKFVPQIKETENE